METSGPPTVLGEKVWQQGDITHTMTRQLPAFTPLLQEYIAISSSRYGCGFPQRFCGSQRQFPLHFTGISSKGFSSQRFYSPLLWTDRRAWVTIVFILAESSQVHSNFRHGEYSLRIELSMFRLLTGLLPFRFIQPHFPPSILLNIQSRESWTANQSYPCE